MAITTKTNKTYKQLLGFVKKVNILAVDNLKKNYPGEVLELLEDGISPTRGGKWASTYSQRYIKEIKKGKYTGKTIQPVNLKLTGRMYRSLKATAVPAAGKYTIEFTDPKAKIHDQGLEGKPVRRLFPNSGEALHPNLTVIITQSYRIAAAAVAKLASDK